MSPRMQQPFAWAAALVLVFASAVTSAAVQPTQPDPHHPVIAGYGTIEPQPDAAIHSDPRLDYKVVFSITQGSKDPAKVNESLDKVARFINLLGSDNIHIKPGHVLAVIHGGATPLVLDDAHYQARYHVANPNLALVDALKKAGVKVHVCGQALAGQKIPHDQVASSIPIDVSALTTMATLQLQGWALLPD